MPERVHTVHTLSLARVFYGLAEEKWDDGSSRRVQSGHRTKSRILQSPMGPDADAAFLVCLLAPFVLGFHSGQRKLWPPRTELDCYFISKLR